MGRQQTVTTLAMELCPIDLHGMIQSARFTNKRFLFSVVRFLASCYTVQVGRTFKHSWDNLLSPIICKLSDLKNVVQVL